MHATSRNRDRRELLAETFPARIERRPACPSHACVPGRFAATTRTFRHLVIVDSKAPVSFFAYPGKASYLVPTGAGVGLATDDERGNRAESLADALAAVVRGCTRTTIERPRAAPRRCVAAAISDAPESATCR